jgi:hypothetical protein
MRRFGIGLLGVLSCGGHTAPQGAPPSTTFVEPAPGERHLTHIRQLTFGGNNAESYFNSKGTQLIFQRQEKVDSACDQEYIINIDGSGLRRISNGLGRTTCGYFYGNDQRVLYSSTFKHSPGVGLPDWSRAASGALELEIYTSETRWNRSASATDNSAYNQSTLSPDRKRIIFTSTRDAIWSCTPLTSTAPTLPDHPPGRVRRRRILFPGREADRLAGRLPDDRRRHRRLSPSAGARLVRPRTSTLDRECGR